MSDFSDDGWGSFEPARKSPQPIRLPDDSNRRSSFISLQMDRTLPVVESPGVTPSPTRDEEPSFDVTFNSSTTVISKPPPTTVFGRQMPTNVQSFGGQQVPPAQKSGGFGSESQDSVDFGVEKKIERPPFGAPPTKSTVFGVQSKPSFLNSKSTKIEQETKSTGFGTPPAPVHKFGQQTEEKPAGFGAEPPFGIQQSKPSGFGETKSNVFGIQQPAKPSGFGEEKSKPTGFGEKAAVFGTQEPTKPSGFGDDKTHVFGIQKPKPSGFGSNVKNAATGEMSPFNKPPPTEEKRQGSQFGADFTRPSIDANQTEDSLMDGVCTDEDETILMSNQSVKHQPGSRVGSDFQPPSSSTFAKSTFGSDSNRPFQQGSQFGADFEAPVNAPTVASLNSKQPEKRPFQGSQFGADFEAPNVGTNTKAVHHDVAPPQNRPIQRQQDLDALSDDGWAEDNSEIALPPEDSVQTIQAETSSMVNQSQTVIGSQKGGFGGLSSSGGFGSNSRVQPQPGSSSGGFGAHTSNGGFGSQPRSDFGSKQPSGGFGAGTQSAFGTQPQSALGNKPSRGEVQDSGFASRSQSGFATKSFSGGLGANSESGFKTEPSGGHNTAFGSKPASGGFGAAQTTSGFGAKSSSGGFGSQPQPGFGTSAQSASKPSNSGFGTTSKSSSGGFGAQVQSGFGSKNQNSGFGTSSQTGFGSKPAFGGANEDTGFGSQQQSGFGLSAAASSGQTTTGGFGSNDKGFGRYASSNQGEGRPEQDRTCYNCRGVGHRSSDCPEPQRPKVCNNCQAEGHFSRECDQPRRARPCHNCQQEGHFAAECQNERVEIAPPGACTRCKEEGHWSKECPTRPRDLDGNILQPFDYVEKAEDELFETIKPTSQWWIDQEQDIVISMADSNIPDIKSFEQFPQIDEQVLENLKRMQLEIPMPIQRAAYRPIYSGTDVVACAHTGSGKTLAFLLPLVTRLLQSSWNSDQDDEVPSPRLVIVAPTRELALQTFDVVRMVTYKTSLTKDIVYGGTSRSGNLQQLARHRKLAILVGTIGRLKDFVASGELSLAKVQHIVLDEADRMVDAHDFGEEVVELFKSSEERTAQMALFSASFKDEIQKQDLLKVVKSNFAMITVNEFGTANRNIKQDIICVDRSEKLPKLLEILGIDENYLLIEGNRVQNDKTLIFVNSVKFASTLAARFSDTGLSVMPMHSYMMQQQREQVLKDFESGKYHILVASNVCARGLDISRLSHVINYDMPDGNGFDEYVNRIGRTGRAGFHGDSTAFFDQSADIEIAGPLISVLEKAGKTVPEWLKDLNQSSAAHQDADAEEEW